MMGELGEISRKMSIADIYPVFNMYQYSAEHLTQKMDIMIILTLGLRKLRLRKE